MAKDVLQFYTVQNVIISFIDVVVLLDMRTSVKSQRFKPFSKSCKL